MKEKLPGVNGKMLTLTFFELYVVYIKKIRIIFFHTLLAMHHSVASYKKLVHEV